MDKKSVEEIEAEIGTKLSVTPCPVDEVVKLISTLPPSKGEANAAALLAAMGEAGDFDGALKAVTGCGRLLNSCLSGVGVRDALRRTTKDRTLLSFIDAVGFDVRPDLNEPVKRLERLVSFRPGAYVLSRAWGLGQVKRIDDFYRRVIVDFPARPGHQFTYDAACETLSIAPDGHILLTLKGDPDRIKAQMKEKPGEFVVAMLESFGNMPVSRLEELVNQYGFARLLPDNGRNRGDKAAKWKSFWEKARAELRTNKCVAIPTRRAEPIVLKASEETYGDTWFSAFAKECDPKSIFASVAELQSSKAHFAKLGDEQKACIAERLRYALKGVRGVDDSLYLRIAFCLDGLGFDPETVAKARNYMWAEERYLDAARVLPARDMARFVAFLSMGFTEEERAERKQKLFDNLSVMTYSLLCATLDAFKKDSVCEHAAADLLKSPHAPAPLVTYIIGRYSYFVEWESLPPLVVILTHAIALGEGKQTGETLRMQNTIRRLFADQKWLEDMFKRLKPADQALFFERFQASIAWDPSTHHMIVVRMTKIVPELAARQIKKVAAKTVERITSLRSYAERQAEYERLVTKDIPENTKRIQFAKSYGDLSENAEYQYAKDEERVLHQKQDELQKQLNEVKAVDFADVVSETVCPGTTVVIETASGEERTYTVLGEWDNYLDLGVISCNTKLAQNMVGRKAGDEIDLPDAEGRVSKAVVKSVSPLSDETKEWVKAPAV